jgi:hypothetical protein
MAAGRDIPAGDKPLAHWRIHRRAALVAFLFCPIWAEITHTCTTLQSRLKGKDRLAAVPRIGIGCGNQAERRKTDHRLLVALPAARLVPTKISGRPTEVPCLRRQGPAPPGRHCLAFLPDLGRNCPSSQRPVEAKRARPWEATPSIIFSGIFFQKRVAVRPYVG